MDNCNTFKPIPVTCDYWYSLFSTKEYSSSTIIFHQKKQHPEFPLKFTPFIIKCSRCQEEVPITGIFLHNSTCEARQNKETLDTIIEEIAGSVRATCKFCSRKFTLERIDKHESACKNAVKKRPLFDMLKKRIPFLDETKKAVTTKRSSIKLKYPNSKWQKQHLQLLKNLRYENEESLYEDYVTCPYCSRKFAPISAEKHIDICKNILNKPKPPPSIASQKFPSLKKLEQPLSIRTNSMKSLWRPYSVHNNQSYIDRTVNNGILSTSIEEPVSLANITSEIASSPLRIPPLKQENSQPNFGKFKLRDLTPIESSKGLVRILGEHAKKLRPSATVKHIERDEMPALIYPKIPKSKAKDTKRSNSTQRVGETVLCCGSCGAGLPLKARFCMMCGIIMQR